SALFLIVTIVMIVLPAGVSAGTTYLSDGPDLSVSLAGPNEFYPGDSAVFLVSLSNTGISEGKIVQPSLNSPDDQPGTAKLVTVGLGPGKAPIEVRSDPQMVGDIPSGSTAHISFAVQIAADAPPGEYELPVNLGYLVITIAEQFGGETIRYQYAAENRTVSLPVLIKPRLIAEAANVTTEHLFAGYEGYVTVNVLNSGYENGTAAVAKIGAVPGTPVSPVENAVYIGEFPAGTTIPCRYRVAVDSGAGAGTYPLTLSVEYVNSEGDTVRSDPVTFGVTVGGKADFTLSGTNEPLFPGSTNTIGVEFLNSGEAPVYGAQARISPSAPFTATDSIAALGDIAPGERALAKFTVAVDKGATPKDYGLDAEVRFRDGLGTVHISDPLEIRLQVVPRTGLDAVLANPVVLTVIVAVAVGAGYIIYRRRRT
ncbi:MAG: NEW3 domain-containing protein, partial [Methanoregulaceae archaeon]|nr:NEW3 domain-containing protein [Methanoregulaceae archaeon]